MRTTRYLAPAGVAGAIALGAWIPSITSASAQTPTLPSITAQQLIVKAQGAHPAGFSGTVRWVANLGLPDVSGLTGGGGQSADHSGFDPTSLLSGTHDISVWAAKGGARLALPGSLTESDLVANTQGLWFYDSATQKVTHYVAPAGGAGADHRAAGRAEPAVTPDQVAQRLLAHLAPTTTVTVASPVYVAHRATYQLVLAPKAAGSTVGSVTIAVDAATGLPLRVQVTPEGTTTPALSLGFTRIHLSVPAASNFAAPHGSATVTKTLPAGGDHHRQGPGGAMPALTGTGWGSIATLNAPAGGRSARQLDQASTAVTGSFGTARLVHTNLLNALVLPDGRILAGFVTPSALEAAASNAG